MGSPHKPYVLEVESADADQQNEKLERAVPELPVADSDSAATWSWRARLWRFARFVGPTFIIATTFVDPGGLGAALEQGSQAEFSLLWITWWSIVLGYVFQVLAARVGIVSGKSLGALCVERYGKGWVRGIILVFIQGSVFGDDIQACMGAAIALRIMTGMPWWAAVLLTVVVSLLLTLAYYWSAVKLEWFIGIVLGVMLVLVCINAGHGHASPRDVIYGWVVPQVRPGQVLTVVGSVGGVLTPSALFLGSAMVLNRPVNRGSARDVRQGVLYSTLELMLGMVGAFFILLPVTITFANGFYRDECSAQGLAWVPSDGQCGGLSLNDGPDALYSLYGVAAKYVFAVTLLLSGVTSMVSATLGGQATWEGLCGAKLAFWKVVVITRSIVLVPTLVVAITKGTDDSVFTEIDDWVNIFMSLAMPMAAIPVIDMAANKLLMKGHAIHPLRTAASVLCVLALITVNFYLMAEFLFEPDTFGSEGDFPTSSTFYAGVGAVWLFYAYMLYQVARPGLIDMALWSWNHIRFSKGHSTE